MINKFFLNKGFLMRIIPNIISATDNDIHQEAKKYPKTVIVALAAFSLIETAALVIGLVGLAPLFVTLPVATAVIGGITVALLGFLWSQHHYAAT